MILQLEVVIVRPEERAVGAWHNRRGPGAVYLGLALWWAQLEVSVRRYGV
jgi:hypothetical protein